MNIFRKAAAQLGQWVSDLLGDQDKSSYWYSRGTYSGRVVTPETSMQSSAVMACVRLLSETEACLPIDLMQKTPGGRVEIPNHPVVDVLDFEPNPDMSAVDYRMAMMLSAALWGNCYSYKVRASDGRLLALWPFLPDRMKMARKNGQIWYGYQPQGGPIQEFAADEIFHPRTLSLDGMFGLSPVTLHRQGIGVALDAEELAGRFFGNDATPGLILEYPQKLSAPAKKDILESFNQAHEGIGNKFRAGIAEGGLTVKTITMPLKDAEFLETRKFQRSEIASIYRIPPHMIGDVDRSTSWGTGIEQMSIGFVTFTMLPWLTMLEKQFRRSLLTPAEKQKGFYFKHNVNALLRGDYKTRMEGYAIAIDRGVINPNEARGFEDLNPYKGGEKYRMPLNIGFADAAALPPEAAKLKLLEFARQAEEQKSQMDLLTFLQQKDKRVQ